MYSLKRHEVDRLVSVLTVFGWTVEDEQYDDVSVMLRIRRVFSPDLLAAEAKVAGVGEPQ